jgi:O-antigen ligase
MAAKSLPILPVTLLPGLAILVGCLALNGIWLPLALVGALTLIACMSSLSLLIALTAVAQLPNDNPAVILQQASIQTTPLVLLHIGSIDIRLYDLVLLLLLARLSIERCRPARRLETPHLLTGFWIGINTISLLAASSHFQHSVVPEQVVAYGRFLTATILIFLLPFTLDSARKLHIYWRFLVAFLLLQSAFAVIVVLSGGQVLRAHGLSGPADLGIASTVGLVSLLAYPNLWSARSRNLAIPVFAAAIVLSISKAAYFAVAASLMAMVVSHQKRLVPVLLIGLAVFAGIWTTPVRATLENTLNAYESHDGSMSERYAFCLAALRIGMDSPLVGHGWASYRFYSATVHSMYPRELARVDSITQTHSGYASFLFETGLLGLISFLGMLIASLQSARRLENAASPISRQFGLMFVPILCGYVVWFAFNEILPGSVANLLFWVLLGCVASVSPSDPGGRTSNTDHFGSHSAVVSQGVA